MTWRNRSIMLVANKSVLIIVDTVHVRTDAGHPLFTRYAMISFASLMLIVAGCKPNFDKMLDEGALDGIEGEVIRMLSENPANTDSFVPPGDWPDGVYDLNPDRVHVDPLGAYIVLWRFFNREEGIFVPRPGTPLKYDESTDPQISNLYGSVFAYKRKKDS